MRGDAQYPDQLPVPVLISLLGTEFDFMARSPIASRPRAYSPVLAKCPCLGSPVYLRRSWLVIIANLKAGATTGRFGWLGQVPATEDDGSSRHWQTPLRSPLGLPKSAPNLQNAKAQ